MTSQNLAPEKCVVLVPVGGHIEPRCEEGLAELERRGYKVWRVRGYAAIDQGRNQMASDALAQGFDETLWIDSDVGFDPNDVEQIRRHNAPMVCGIYPKKGKRELAIHVLPGTEKLVFGKGGGLVEIKYAATGFLHVRREVYETISRQLKLPLCNTQFKRPMWPFFLPLIHEDQNGPWYLAEDYAFCERARQCGFRILADTTIRLYHVGSYAYSWEDAGSDPKRYESYTYHLQGPKNPGGQQPAEKKSVKQTSPKTKARPQSLSAEEHQRQATALAQLRADFPWPDEKPNVVERPTEGWLHEGVKQALSLHLSSDTKLVIEIGSWLGLSTRFIADRAPGATVIVLDHWRGSEEHARQPELAELLLVLYETFLANCWCYRERLLPLRMGGDEGLALLAKMQLKPDVVYLDADHAYEAVRRDFETILDTFPAAVVVGDDWDWPGVESAVTDVARARRLAIDTDGIAWRHIPAVRRDDRLKQST